MKRVILPSHSSINAILLENVPEDTPIFVKKDGIIVGMIVKEIPHKDPWIIRLGGESGSAGYFKTRKECLIYCLDFGYEYFIP